MRQEEIPDKQIKAGISRSGFVDQDRLCVECEAAFRFTAAAQWRHDAKGWKPPRRCLPCRAARRAVPPSQTPHYDANRAQRPFRTW